MNKKRPSGDELVGLKKKIQARGKELGITPKRLQAYLDAFVKTKDREAAFKKATEGLKINPGDEPSVREYLGGNPMKLFVK